MTDIYEVTMKKIKPNADRVVELVVKIEGLDRQAAFSKASTIAFKLGLEFDMSYIIRGVKEE